jgi:hypothetical protein
MWLIFKRALVILLLLIFSFIFFIVRITNLQFKDIDPNNPPRFITSNFMDIDNIFIISKYRSCIGHSAEANGEKCRSMRHIFGGQNEPSSQFSSADNKWEKIHNRPTIDNSFNIYAPIDGLITDVTRTNYKDFDENRPNGIGGTIIIRSLKYPGYFVRIDSVFPDENLKFIHKVKSGDKIGVICKQCPGEINVGYNYIGGERGISFFAAMNDDVFAQFQKRGMKSRDDAIITKEYRDSHPFKCADPNNETSEIIDNPEMHDLFFSYVVLSGYLIPPSDKE